MLKISGKNDIKNFLKKIGYNVIFKLPLEKTQLKFSLQGLRREYKKW